MSEKKTSRREWIAKTGSTLAAAAVAPKILRAINRDPGKADRFPQTGTSASDQDASRAKRMKWWHEARFGMFIHWGLYSVLGRHEWVMENEGIPVSEYEALAKRFQPKPNFARDWARLAKQAGQKYMVMTTKHHEGFCNFASKLTDYCAPKQAAGRDLV